MSLKALIAAFVLYLWLYSNVLLSNTIHIYVCGENISSSQCSRDAVYVQIFRTYEIQYALCYSHHLDAYRIYDLTIFTC